MRKSSERDGWGRATGIALIAAVAFAVRLVHLDHTPDYDELYHVLAARSLVESGTLVLPGGAPYERAWGLTYMIATLFEVAGESFRVARIPEVLFGTALVALLFAWVRFEAGPLAGWIAGLLLCFDPSAIHLSQLARFYSLHALLMLVAAIAVFNLTKRRPASPAPFTAMLIAAFLALLVARHLQRLTFVGAGALLLWALVSGGPVALRLIAGKRHGRLALTVCGIAAMALALAVVQLGVAERIWGTMQYADLWALGGRDVPEFYHLMLLDRYPAIWVLFPLVILAAGSGYLRMTLFCLCFFGVGFGFHSLAAWKAERYLFWAMPMFFAVAAIGLSVSLPAVLEGFRNLINWFLRGRAPRWVVGPGAIAVVAMTVFFAAVSGGAFRYTLALLTFDDADWPYPNLFRGEADWMAAEPILQPLVEDVELVVVSAGPKALYALGRFDVSIFATDLLGPKGQGEEFATNLTPLGRPVISRTDSLGRLMRCYSSGLIVAEQKHWKKRWAVPRDVAAMIEARARAVPIDEALGLRAFTWDNPNATGECAGLIPRARR